MKYKIVLKTTHRHLDRVQLCMDTWLSSLDYVCLTDRLSGKFKEISGSDREDYGSAEEKTCYFINHVKATNEYDDYDWLVFIDDDAILNVAMFNRIIKHLDKTILYGLPMGGFPLKPDLVFPSGGASYYISPSLIKQCNSMIDQKWGAEDVSVGNWIKENNLKLLDYFYIDQQKYALRLNGWFPFAEESKRMSHHDPTDQTRYAVRLLDTVDKLGGRDYFLKSHMTHHYLRDPEVMLYVYERLIAWKESDLDYYKL